MFKPRLSSEYGLVVTAGLPWNPYIKRVSATTSLAPTLDNFQQEWARMNRDLGQPEPRTGEPVSWASPLRCVLDLEKVVPPDDDGSGGKFWIAAGMRASDPQVIACNEAVAAIVRSFRAAYPHTLLSFWGGPLLELTNLCSAMLDAADFATHSLGSDWLHTWRDVQRMVRLYESCYAPYGFGPDRLLLCIQALNNDGKPRPGTWLRDAAQIVADQGHSLMLTWPPAHNVHAEYGQALVDSIRPFFE